MLLVVHRNSQVGAVTSRRDLGKPKRPYFSCTAAFSASTTRVP
jgi:hypothetical protein